MARYEQVLTGYSKYSSFITNQEPFRSICLRLLNLYPNYIADRQIVILPNNNNKVLIPFQSDIEVKSVTNLKTKFYRLPDMDSSKHLIPKSLTMKFLPCCCSYFSGKCSEMDRQTIKLALMVIKQNSITLRSQDELQKQDQRLEIIESKLDKLFELLQKTKSPPLTDS